MAILTQRQSFSGVEVIMTYDDQSMLLTKVYIDNSSEQWVTIVCGSPAWSYRIRPGRIIHINLLAVQRPTWEWIVWIDADSGTERRVCGGFSSRALLGD